MLAVTSTLANEKATYSSIITIVLVIC